MALSCGPRLGIGFQLLPEIGQLGRQWRLEAELFACDRVDEAEFGGVEG
jgi:hypothetical protein